jgi:hypothetical protein
MPSAHPRSAGGMMSTTYEKLATKNMEKPMPWHARTTASSGTPPGTAASSEAATVRPIPTSMNGRRPMTSTQGPISGWQTMPTPLKRPITMPIWISLPPSCWM